MGNSKRNKVSVSWAKGIQACQSKSSVLPDPNPSKNGWNTFEEIRQELGLGEVKIRRFLQEGLQDGSIIRFEGSTISKLDPNKLKRTIWYKMI